MDRIKQKLCDVQGRLFVNSIDAGYESAVFGKDFLRSEVARKLDSEYNRLQWAGEEYWMEELQAEVSLRKGEDRYDKDSMFWMGYVYRYWHFYTGESSKEILRIAPVRTLHKNYKVCQELEPDWLIDQLREAYLQKNPKKQH